MKIVRKPNEMYWTIKSTSRGLLKIDTERIGKPVVDTCTDYKRFFAPLSTSNNHYQFIFVVFFY